MIYHVCSTLLMIGFLGLVAQALLGGAHVGHLGQHAGHAHGGHAGHSGAQGHGHAQNPAQHSEGQARAASALWAVLSPLTIFSVCVGMGATGLLLKHLRLPPTWVALAALLGGLLFYGLVIRPLWGFIFQFASTPSLALEGSVAREAEALSSFDSGGKGLVRLTVDGQIVRILATLESDERTEAPSIHPGDKLTVTSVDGRTNSCRVARL